MPVKDIWNSNRILHCPIAGFCLTPAEQRGICKRNDEYKKNKYAGIDLHHFIIDNISKKTSIAKQIQKKLNQKYKKEIACSQGISAKDWVSTVIENLNWKNFGSFIWISAIYQDLTETQHRQIFNRVHVYGHEMLFDCYDIARNHENLKQQHSLISNKYGGIRKKYRDSEKERIMLKRENHNLKSVNKHMQNEVPLLLPEKMPDSQSDVIRLKQLLDAHRETIYELKQEIKRLNKTIVDDFSCHDDLKKDFNNFLTALNRPNEECMECDKIDLCQRRVLFVGGMYKMKRYYHNLVNQLGGRFKYHDGRSQHNHTDLTVLVGWSDFVLCPVDKNSHTACIQVKKICKKTGKQYFMLRKSSISTVYKTLQSVAKQFV